MPPEPEPVDEIDMAPACSPLEAEVASLRAALATATRERAAERTGRTRAEAALRAARSAALQCGCGSGGGPTPVGAFPLAPIGVLRSVFSARNGTPRQPLLVAGALAALTLAPHVSPAALHGLDEFSHVWVLFLFHANTNLAAALAGGGGAQGGGSAVRASAPATVHVPRLGGAKRGVLATRSPHRPCPVGLSLGRVVSVRGRVLTIAGLDCVDGTPVFDVKPYLSFADGAADAAAPAWACDGAGTCGTFADPLALRPPLVSPAAAARLEGAWRAVAEAAAEGGRSAAAAAAAAPLTPSAAAFASLVRASLARDIRATHARARDAAAGVRGGGEEGGGGGAEGGGEAGGTHDDDDDNGGGEGGEGGALPQVGRWRLLLDGVDVGYELRGGRAVVVDARPAGGARPPRGDGANARADERAAPAGGAGPGDGGEGESEI